MMASLAFSGPNAQETGNASPRESLTLMTYNVLADRVEEDQRVRALLDIMKAEDPDIIALQEVTPWFLSALRDDEWVQKTYRGSDIRPEEPAPGGQYFLSKLPFRNPYYDVLPGRQRRIVVTIEVEIDGITMMLATTHMESRLEDGPVRAEQLDAILELLADADEAVVIGDLNFGDGEDEESHLDPKYVDLWKALDPDNPGYTWNIEASPMAKAGSFPGEPSRRLDRILIRSDRWRPAAVRIVGDQPVSENGALFPSDHFGLVGSVRKTGG